MLSEPYATWFADAPLDGTYGHTLSSLRRVSPLPPPPGFADLWRGWHAQSRSGDPRPSLVPSHTTATHTVSIVSMTMPDGVIVRGWFAMPTTAEVRIGVVHGHGYGPMDAPRLARVPADAAALFPLARGFGVLNTDVGGPSDKNEHVIAGISSAETYLVGLCARDLWSAATALTALAGDVALYYVGESFGGGLGALALPWDDRFVGATLIVPTFGQHDERLAVRCEGSGEAVRRHVRLHPAAREVLRYFDASSSALSLRIPTRVEAALWDAHVPPQGQFAVANAVDPELLELHVLAAGHADFPHLQSQTDEAIAGTLAHIRRVTLDACL